MKLTLGDLELLEETVGQPFSDIVEKPTAKALVVIAWIVNRKDKPDFTLDDARALDIAEMNTIGQSFMAAIPDTPDPTDAVS